LLRERDVNGLGRSRGRERGLVKREKVKGRPEHLDKLDTGKR
jgi:hypothetical protein